MLYLFQILINELKLFFNRNRMNDGYVLVELKPTDRVATWRGGVAPLWGDDSRTS